MNFWGHLHTIAKHRFLVMCGCFRVGLYWQGLTHDLSKFSPTEFWPGVRFYQGTRSPNAAERELNGYSLAWMHHKGRNKHHFEYWTDVPPDSKHYQPVPMPTRYLVEMFMDRVAASKTYMGDSYTDSSSLDYLERRERPEMHPDTYHKIHFLLTLLAEKGEAETFAFIRDHVLKGEPFAEETQY